MAVTTFDYHTKSKTLAKRAFSHVKSLFQTVRATMSKSPKVTSVKTVVSDHWMKVAGYGSFSFGFYQIYHPLGWIVAGILVVLLEHQVSE